MVRTRQRFGDRLRNEDRSIRPRPILAWFIATLMRTVGRTLRLELDDRAGYVNSNGKCLMAVWHNRILALPVFYERFGAGKRIVVLTSASRDGELLAGVVRVFGIGAVRGSSSRRGAAALRELTAEIERGTDIVITPDGPRGPKYRLGQGIVYLAQKCGIPILRIHVKYESYWELKTWDRFRIPKPFSKVRVTLPCFDFIPAAGDEGAVERERERIERLLSEEADSDEPVANH